jgi:hypothetical protein
VAFFNGNWYANGGNGLGPVPFRRAGVPGEFHSVPRAPERLSSATQYCQVWPRQMHNSAPSSNDVPADPLPNVSCPAAPRANVFLHLHAADVTAASAAQQHCYMHLVQYSTAAACCNTFMYVRATDPLCSFILLFQVCAETPTKKCRPPPTWQTSLDR